MLLEAKGLLPFCSDLSPYSRGCFYHFAPKRPNFYPTPTLWPNSNFFEERPYPARPPDTSRGSGLRDFLV